MLPWETVFQKGHYGDYRYARTEKAKDDSGNWRDGELVGTKFGIDAASHKEVDIDALTLETATEIYWQEWCQAGIETFAPGIGEAYFNCRVNCGRGTAQTLMHGPGYPRTADGFLDAQEAWYKRLVIQRRASRGEHAGDTKWLKQHPDLAPDQTGWLSRTADLRKFVRE